MKPDLQLEAYIELFDNPRNDESVVAEMLSKRHPHLSAVDINQAIAIAKSARIANFNAPSTYECSTASEAGNTFSKYLQTAVPDVSDGLLQKLVYANMRAWAY